ncbi:MAG: transposase [Anaerolineales bacterium]|jgi:REP element-mobilizing transposase RayT
MRANLDTQRDLRSGRGGRQSKDGDRLPSPNVHLEPVPRRDYELSYACLLIPRASDHSLNGKVAGFIKSTLQDISKTFGWRLDFIQVDSQYLQWVISAPAATPPSRCIHLIRQETSKGILGKFREFRSKDKKNGGSQDFWAPGYLVLVGSSPHPPEIIQEFIRMTRLQQGLPPR